MEGNIDVVGIIKDVGFPTFVCLYFMWLNVKVLKPLTEAVNKLVTLMERATGEDVTP